MVDFYDSEKADAITEEGRKFLRHLIDVVWNYVTESTEVPATSTADNLIDEATKTWRDDDNSGK